MRSTVTRVLVVLAIAALSATVWRVGNAQERIFADIRDEAFFAGRLQASSSELDIALDRLIRTGDLSQPIDTPSLERLVAELRAVAGPGPETETVAAVEAAARDFSTAAQQTVLAVAQRQYAAFAALVPQRKAAYGRLQGSVLRFFETLDADYEHRQAKSDILLRSVIGALGFGGVFALVVVERRGRAARRRRDGETRLTEILQVARSEDEAYRVLARHVEQVVDSGSHAVVLNRNNSENRLEPRTPLDQHPELTEPLEGAAPDSCLAIRLSKPHERGRGDDPLMPCHVCGNLPTRSTCIPTLAGGEVIGSVLVEHDKRLRASTLEQLVMAVASAAPVIANLRSLAVAETRAATDALTGLANNRSIQDTLKRMVAHANRSDTPLAAILFDLDLFKQINDTYGHERGDEALAAVAAVATTSVRGSDFVGRWGGEEFLVLLPDTDHDGAAHVAEKMRDAIAHITLEGIERQLTASFGVAALPHDADDGSSLLRSADRALYRAKSNGRNRVETLDHTTPPQPELTLTSAT